MWKPENVPYMPQATPSWVNTVFTASRSEAAINEARSDTSVSAIAVRAAVPAAADTGLALNVP